MPVYHYIRLQEKTGMQITTKSKDEKKKVGVISNKKKKRGKPV
jgi:hypothetical protein